MKKISHKKFVLLLISALAAVVVAMVWFVCVRAGGSREIRNVVLISIDTCRADHLSCYGYIRPITPNIDAVAAQSILFQDVVSPVPLTLPAHSSIMTGTIPPYHGVRDNMEYKLGDSQLTLAEILAKNGFKTAAIISAFVLDSQFGLARGFDYYNDRFEEEHKFLQISERRGREVSRLANTWLEQNRNERFFLFLHYFDPHSDYRPPEPFASRFKDSPYAGEIAYADDCIGQVIDKLKVLNIYDSALIIILGDHGEGLGQHGENEHNFFIYQSTIKVPLIIKPPHSQKPRKIDTQVGLIDIMPTMLEMLDIDAPPEIQGRDITALLEQNSNPAATKQTPYYCESLYPTKYNCNPLYGITSRPWKYIWTTKPELYNLQTDPGEKNNLIGAEPAEAENLQKKLKHILATQSSDHTDNILDLDAQTTARLESLGYVSGKLDDTAEIDPQKENPKELIDYHRMSRQYTIALENKNFNQAKKICERMLSKYKDITQTYYLWGYVAFEQGQIAEAAEKFTTFVNSNPDNAKGQYRLGLALARMNRHEEAIEHFRKSIRITPDDYMLYGNLALSLNQLGKYDEAVKQFEHLLRLRPDDPDAHANIAIALALQNKLDQAVYHYNQALRLRPDDPGVHINLGKAFAQQNSLDNALHHWNTALKLTAPQSPVQLQLRNLMAEQLAKHGRIPQAVEQFKELLRITPGNHQLHYNLGLLYHRQNRFEKAISHWTEVLKLKPDHLQTINSFAWILATNSQTKYRDPQRAVRLAQKACNLTNFNDPTQLDTLAAAYAADGQFDKAVETAQKALDLAIAQNRKNIADQIKNRLTLYIEDEPCLEIHQ